MHVPDVSDALVACHVLVFHVTIVLVGVIVLQNVMANANTV